MRQKYVISKHNETNQLIIQEFAELDKDILSIIGEESYDEAAIAAAAHIGPDAVVSRLRTVNLYPVGTYAYRIAEAVTSFYNNGADLPLEVVCDDLEFLNKVGSPLEVLDDVEEEGAEIDDLLDEEFESEEEFDDDYEEGDELSSINTSLKVADDEPADADEEL